MRSFTPTSTVACATWSLLFFSAPAASHDESFIGCEMSTYYSAIDVVNRDEMHKLLTDTHRNVVPYSSTTHDVWDALIDLDSDSTGNNVHLVYQNDYYSALPVADATSWNREHLWPKEYGVGFNGPDHSDLHALRPAHWYNKAARHVNFLSECGVNHSSDACVSPATQLAASDTATDPSTFLPPADKRGDIARALFYMATRYDGEDKDTENLSLSDCPAKPPADTLSTETTVTYAEYGLLSQLLEWHEADPVDLSERIRNNKACESWQGNRNPFVDFPELVQWYFGLPRTVVKEGGGYDCSVPNPPGENPGKVTAAPTKAPTPTLSPTAAPTTAAPSMAPTTRAPTAAPTTATPTGSPSASPTQSPSASPSASPTSVPSSSPTPAPELDTCNGLSAGDVMFAGFNSDNPDAVAIVALREIPRDTAIYMTNNPWNDETASFVPGGGIEKFLVPETGLPTSTIFGYGSTSLPYTQDWVTSGSFTLSEKSNTMFLYCYDSTEDGSPPVLLSALTYTFNGWAPTPEAMHSSNSMLPKNLPEYTHINLPHYDNYVYVGKKEGGKIDILKTISDPTRWEGSNHARHELMGTLGTFNVSP